MSNLTSPTQLILTLLAGTSLLFSGVVLAGDSSASMADKDAAAPVSAAKLAPTRMIQMKPDEKRPLVMNSNERNPYAHRSVEKIKPEEEDNKEELKLRERLSLLRVTGRSMSQNGLRVLLGDIILEKGKLLPQLLEDQTEVLRVEKIDSEMVVLEWLDTKTGQATGKTMQVLYDLRPSVGYVLQGQLASNQAENSAPVMGVLRTASTQAPQAEQSGTVESSNPRIPTPPPTLDPSIPKAVLRAGQ